MSRYNRPSLPATRQEWRRQVTRSDDPQARHLASALLQARLDEAYAPKTWRHVLFGLAKDAIVHGKREALQCVLVAGAPLEQPDAKEDGLLLLAAHYAERDMVSLLLSAGSDPAAASTQSGRTVMHIAALHGDVAWMEKLAARGCSWTPDHEGMWPLDLLKEGAAKVGCPVQAAVIARLEAACLSAKLDGSVQVGLRPRSRF